MFAIRTIVEEEMPEHIRNASSPKGSLGHFHNFVFQEEWCKVTTLGEQSLIDNTRKLDDRQYFTKVKSLYHEIFELDPNSKIFN